MSKTYIELSGSSIRQIRPDRELSHDEICFEDLFLISQMSATCVGPDGTFFDCPVGCPCNAYESKNISYEDLCLQMCQELSDNFGLKSMAWENENDYSLIGHVHNYSKVEAWQNPEMAVPEAEPQKIMRLNIDGNCTDFTSRHPLIYEQPEPYIGELRFLMLPVLPSIPNDDSFYDSENFDGWVYPDGRMVSKRRFAQAFEEFGDQFGAADDETFRLPNLSSFIKLNIPSNPSAVIPELTPEISELLPHKHSISNPNLSGTLQAKMSFYATGNTKKGFACHAAGTFQKPNASQDYDMTFKLTKIDTKDDGKTDTVSYNAKTYPNHMTMPVQIYIGGVK